MSEITRIRIAKKEANSGHIISHTRQSRIDDSQGSVRANSLDELGALSLRRQWEHLAATLGAGYLGEEAEVRVRTRAVAWLGTLVTAAMLLSACTGGPSSTRPGNVSAKQAADIAQLPKWEQTLFRALFREPTVTSLPRVVPATGVALIIAAKPKDFGPMIYLQPARPSRRDITAAVADSMARKDVGGPISNTVFGIGTIPGSVVTERSVWVVTIPTKPNAGGGSCCPFRPGQTTSCLSGRPKIYTSTVVVIDAASGQMLEGFQA